MLLPAAVNYPCQPSCIKHCSCRPAHSLTRAVPPAARHKLQNKWPVVSPDVALGLARPPRHPAPAKPAAQRAGPLVTPGAAPRQGPEAGRPRRRGAGGKRAAAAEAPGEGRRRARGSCSFYFFF